MADDERTESGSYDFGKGMDLRDDAKVSDVVGALKGPVQKDLMKHEGKRVSKAQYIPHDYHTPDATAATTEGEDSEGKKKPSILRD